MEMETEKKKPISRTVRSGVVASKKSDITDPVKRIRNPTASKIAGSKVVKINHIHHVLREAFPTERRMWVVDKLYPYSRYGELLIDEPRLGYNIQDCLRKAAVLRQHNIKYVVLQYGSQPIACTDDDLSLAEFGEVIGKPEITDDKPAVTETVITKAPKSKSEAKRISEVTGKKVKAAVKPKKGKPGKSR